VTTKLRENIEALLEYIFATEGDSYEEYLQDNDDGSDHVFQIAAETRVLLNEEMGLKMIRASMNPSAIANLANH
jgi:hypothetical protein